MRPRLTLPILMLVTALAAPTAIQAQTPEQLAKRAAIAAQQPSAPPVQGATDFPSSGALEVALDLPSGLGATTTTYGMPAQIAVMNSLGVITPRNGSDFVVLSSGQAGSTAPEPGTSFGMGLGGPLGYDTAMVSLTLTVPDGVTTLSFDFLFLSAEYPDFIQAGFNDTFSATLQTPSGSQQLAFDRAGRPINVDSVSFYPAFSSNAGGTGYDIFAPDPAGVTYVFPGGVPDAGLTDWLSASGAVTPGSTITIEFGIADLGDDILDSTVLVDNVRFSSVEVLEGNDPRFRNGNDLTNDAETLSTGGEARIGICADGVSRLLLRMNLNAPGSASFDIANFANSSESGSLGIPRGIPQGGSLQNVASVATANGHKIYAVYHAPLDFVRAGVPGDANARTRNLVINTTFTPQGGGAPENGQINLVIERPPVVLCHGLWSGPATWNGFAPLVGDNRWDFSRVDYSNNNGGRIGINRFQVRRLATQARAAKNRRGIASTQVDWIGHSMGGLLVRSFAATGFFRRADNFGQGDLHKMVTVNTPHWGSPMANILASVRDSWVGDFLIIGMERMGMSIVGGAVDDLSEGSRSLSLMGVTPIRSHSLVGIGGSQILGVANLGLNVAANLAPPPYRNILRLLYWTSTLTTAAIYRGHEHDFIVLRPSQEGGLGGAQITVLGGVGSTHTRVTSHAPAAARCIELLNADVVGGSFAAAIPAPTLNPTDNAFGGPSPAPAGQSVQITTNSTIITGNTNLNITAVPTGGFQPTAMLFMSSAQDFVVDDTPPFSATFTVPVEAVGEFVVSVIGQNASDELAGPDTLGFPVWVPATLNGIEVFSDRIYLNKPGQQGSVTVMGNYSDGIQRNLSDPALGTTYQSSDLQVASIATEGLVTAVGQGSTAIIINNSGFEVSLGAFVTFEPDVSYTGEGCPTTVGIPEIGTDGGAPEIGNPNFRITVDNAPGSSFVLWALKIGALTSLEGTPLPGAPSCVRIYVMPQDLAAGVADSSGHASTLLGIPADPSLAGLPISAQAAVFDANISGAALPIGTSRALEISIGQW